jgi:cytoskeletal protein CcmA (bactofilin family)
MFANSQDVAEKPFPPLPGAETEAGNARRSVLHEDITVNGTLTSDGILDLAGFIEGDLTVDTLVLARTGKIKGNVRARSVTIEGRLEGTISAISVTLKTSAQVTADIVTQKLVIEAGAMIEGHVTSRSNQRPDQTSGSPTA